MTRRMILWLVIFLLLFMVFLFPGEMPDSCHDCVKVPGFKLCFGFNNFLQLSKRTDIQYQKHREGPVHFWDISDLNKIPCSSLCPFLETVLESDNQSLPYKEARYKPASGETGCRLIILYKGTNQAPSGFQLYKDDTGTRASFFFLLPTLKHYLQDF